MNRGVEMAVDPSELPGAVITQQVANGDRGPHGGALRPARQRPDLEAEP